MDRESTEERGRHRLTDRLGDVEFTHLIDEATVTIIANADRITSVRVDPGERSPEWSLLDLSALCRDVRFQMMSPEIRHELKMQVTEVDLFVKMPRPGAGGRRDINYVLWAMKYIDACEVSSGKPMVLLEKRNPGFSAVRLREMMHTARERGLLTAPAPGCAGGKLTPKAIAVLDRHGIAAQ